MKQLEEKEYYADYTAEQAFQYGIETGDYDPFLTSLTPLEVRNFLRDKDKIDSKIWCWVKQFRKGEEVQAASKRKTRRLSEMGCLH